MLFLMTLALGAEPSDLADRAVQVNPGLESMEARAAALGSLASVADRWPDPMLATEYSNVPVNAPLPGNHPMAGIQFKAQQTLPTPGVTALRAGVAEGRVDIQHEATREAELQLRKQVEQTWWKLVLSRALGQVTQDHLARTTELLAAVRTRYEVGSTGQSALLRLQLLADRLRDDLGDFVRAETELCAALSRALAWEQEDFETPTTLEPVAVDGSVDEWLAAALESRPMLRRLRLQIENEQLAADLARVDARPDLTVWAGYRVRTQEMDGTDLISLGVSAPVPVNSSRMGAGMQSAHLEAASALTLELEAAEDMLRAQLSSAHAAWSRGAQKAATYETVLVPAAAATLDATLSDFRVDKAEFSSLYDAEVALLTLERGRLMAAADTHIQQAEVQALIGAPRVGGAP